MPNALVTDLDDQVTLSNRVGLLNKDPLNFTGDR